MMIPRGLFGWSPPHVQPLTPVSEVSEPPESPSPYLDFGSEPVQLDDETQGEELDGVEQPQAAVPFVKLFEYATPVDWLLMSLGFAAAAAHGVALPLFLHYFGKIINLFGTYKLRESGPLDYLEQESSKYALYIVYISGGVLLAGWIEICCWIYTGERQAAVIRSKYVQILLKQDMAFFDTYGSRGSIVSQVSNDALLVQYVLSEKVGNYVHNMATCISGFAVGFVNCWQIALLTLGTAPFIVAAGGISNLFLNRLAEMVQEAYAEAAAIAEQAISYVRTVYSYANETTVKYSYANALQATLRYGVLISLVQGVGLGFIYGIALCSCSLQFWVGRFLIKRKVVSGGEIIAAVFAIILSGLGLNQAATNFQAFDQGRIAAHRLFEMITRIMPPPAPPPEAKTLSEVQGTIELRNVYFSYPSSPDIPILSGLYLTIPARKTVALVGSNGSGKSSVISLIERFYDPTLGEVLLDGENIKNLKADWLRSQIGLVSQEPALLATSIRDNILYGRVASTDEIEEAAKMAHAHTFISSLPAGYDTQVGYGGVVLSEEKMLKLAVARAVLKNPPILLLDEATSNLDADAERSVQEALDILMLGRSTVVIAHRLASIRNADVIAVLQEGLLVEHGTHDELIRVDGSYADLIRFQETAKPARRSRRFTVSPFPVSDQPSPPSTLPRSNTPPLCKSPSLKRQNGVRLPDFAKLIESPPNPSPPPGKKNDSGDLSSESFEKHMGLGAPAIRWQETPDVPALQNLNVDAQPSGQVQESHSPKSSFEALPGKNALEALKNLEVPSLPSLPPLDVRPSHKRQGSNISDPESPVSPLLTTDPRRERSHSKNYTRTISELVETEEKHEPPEMFHSEKPSLLRLARLSSPEWFCALLGSVGAALFGSFNPLFAFILSELVQTYYYAQGDELKKQVSKWCLIIMGMGIVTVLVNFLQHFYFGIMGEKMTERVRRLMFSAILRNEVGWFDKEENSIDVLSIRLANDATYVRAAFSNRLSVLIQDATSILVVLMVGMLVDWRLAVLGLATFFPLTFAAVTQQLWMMGFSGDIREGHSKARRVLEEAVANIHNIFAFNAERKVLHLFKQQMKVPLWRSFVRGQVSGIVFGVSQFFLFASNALVLWYSARLLKIHTQFQQSEFPRPLRGYLVFSFVTFVMIEAFGLAPLILKRRKSIVPVFAIIDRKPKVESDDHVGLKPVHVDGRLEFQDVEFMYPTKPDIVILHNFNLKVEAGQTVAIVGTAGSGKTSVLSLLERFYEPQYGRILLDGKDLKLFNVRWLRSHMGLVQQEPVLFSTTIRENIMYARPNATEAEMTEAARIANAHHFICSLPHGYDTHIGMRGLQLSPGQRLRIVIARVVLKNPPILLIDEASSAVEADSNRVVQEALDHLIMGSRTTIVVAHRLALLRRVDLVALLHDGQIVEEGSHDTLMTKLGLYARLMQPQFNRNLRQHRNT
ncbi:hypothetical protein R1flu_008995 [Riccia fluitans]|uniref:ABC transporter B family member 20 n=1 Tax=Riccia fluitans TaxID=41844 RepID=A0ABD1Z105_9MARC